MQKLLALALLVSINSCFAMEEATVSTSEASQVSQDENVGQQLQRLLSHYMAIKKGLKENAVTFQARLNDLFLAYAQESNVLQAYREYIVAKNTMYNQFSDEEYYQLQTLTDDFVFEAFKEFLRKQSLETDNKQKVEERHIENFKTSTCPKLRQLYKEQNEKAVAAFVQKEINKNCVYSNKTLNVDLTETDYGVLHAFSSLTAKQMESFLDQYDDCSISLTSL